MSYTYRPGLVAVTLATLLACAGCGFKDRLRALLDDDDLATTVVRVGTKLYSEQELQRFFDSRLSEFQDRTEADRVKSNLLESFIEEKLLLIEAERLKVEPNAQVLKQMAEEVAASTAAAEGKAAQRLDSELERSLRESLQMQQYLHDHVTKDVTVTDEQCEAYYKAHLDDFVTNDVVHVREILVDDLEQARKIQKLLAEKKSKNFSELARVYSKAASAEDGGDLGRFQRGDLPEEFEKVVFRLSPGTASGIVRTKYGFHTFLVEEKVVAHQQKFWEVKDQIREKLLLERERAAVASLLRALAGRTPVEIYQARLAFKYTGERFTVR